MSAISLEINFQILYQLHNQFSDTDQWYLTRTHTFKLIHGVLFRIIQIIERTPVKKILYILTSTYDFAFFLELAEFVHKSLARKFQLMERSTRVYIHFCNILRVFMVS